MLAVADVLAVAVAAVVVGVWGNGPAAAFLLALSAPIWIVTAKLAGLYDRDQRTLRHLTVDELPWLVVWALTSTAVLTLLLVPFPALDLSSGDRLLVWGTRSASASSSRRRARSGGGSRAQRMLIVGDGPLAQRSSASSSSSRTSTRDLRAGRELRDLRIHIDELVQKVDRVVIACRGLDEELLGSSCRPVGCTGEARDRAADAGMFGTATNLTTSPTCRCSTTTWDISGMTLAIKRCFDVLVASSSSSRAAVPAARRARDSRRLRPPVFFRQTRPESAADPSGCASSGRWSRTPRRCSRNSSRSTSSSTRCSS
jgi:hypothetical protein